MKNNILLKKLFSTKRPAVFFDIDGVLKRRETAIPGAKTAIELLRNHDIPLTLITNGGGELEIQRANKVSNLLNLQNNHKFKENEVVLSHTIMREMLSKYNDKLILISGIGDIVSIAHHYGFKKFMTIEEYVRIYPKTIPQFLLNESEEELIQKQTKELVEKRLGFPLCNIDHPQIDAIIIMTDTVNWEINVQIIVDHIASPDGISGKVRSHGTSQYTNLYFACGDLVYKDEFTLPRFGAGGLTFAAEYLFKKKYNRSFDYKIIGKPSKEVFEYAKRNLIRNNADKEITEFYMIGDNPDVDILGANKSSIKSFLVRTGVYHDGYHIESNPDYIVDNVLNAVEKIIEIHKNNL